MTTIFKQSPKLEQMNQRLEGSLGGLVGMRFVELGPDYLRATMPVGPRTWQPAQRLHGGASAALAEEVGSTASNLCLDTEIEEAVGVELSTSHLRSLHEGTVVATARPLRIGRTMHVWEIKIESEPGKLICAARLTTAIVRRAK